MSDLVSQNTNTLLKIKQKRFKYGSEREYMSDVLYVPLDKLQCVLSIVGKNQSKIMD